MNNFRELILLWHPEPAKAKALFAKDLGLRLMAARQMYDRDNINSKYFKHLIRAASRRGIKGVTADALVNIAAREAA